MTASDQMPPSPGTVLITGGASGIGLEDCPPAGSTRMDAASSST